MKIKKAFTLVELIVSVTISVIIFVFLMKFIVDTFDEFTYSNRKTKMLLNVYEENNTLKVLKQKFLSGYILIDNDEKKGSDVILLRTLPGEVRHRGYIFGLVNYTRMQIDGSGNIDNIEEKYLGYRKISSRELIELESDPNKVYEYKFNLDEIFPETNIKNFQAELYNSGAIFNLELQADLNWGYEQLGLKYSEVGNKNIEKIIFNF